MPVGHFFETSGCMHGEAMDSETQSIKSLLKQNGICLPLIRNKSDDLFVKTEIKSIADHSGLFETLFASRQQINFSIKDAYYDFLFARKLARFGDLTEVREADLLKKLADEAGEVVNKSKSNAIRFINVHYEEIFSDPKEILSDTEFAGELKYATMDFIVEFNKGIDGAVFEYLGKNYACLIMPRLDDSLLNSLDSNPEKKQRLFSALFSPEHLADPGSLGLKKVLKIWSHELRQKDSPCREHVERRIEELCQKIESFHKSLSSDNVLVHVSSINAVSEFLQEIKSTRAAEFSKYAENAVSMINEYLRDTGYLLKLNIAACDSAVKAPAGPETAGEWLISITHRLNAGGKYESSLSRKPECWLEYAARNVCSDDSFQAGCQQFSSVQEWQNGEKFLTILSDSQLLDAYHKNAMAEIRFISGKLTPADGGLVDDAEMLFPMLKAVAGGIAASSNELQISCYASSMFLCSYTEKFLRLFNRYLSNDAPYTDDLTLGDLLDINKAESHLKEAFGCDYLQLLSFFLIRIPGTEIGRNYRNRLAHWATGMKRGDMTPNFTAVLLWLFTDVLNSVFLYLEIQTVVNAKPDAGGDN